MAKLTSLLVMLGVTFPAYAGSFDERAVCKAERRALDDASGRVGYNQRSADALQPKIADAKAKASAAPDAIGRDGMTAYANMLVQQQRQFLKDRDTATLQVSPANTAVEACVLRERAAFDTANKEEAERVEADIAEAQAAAAHEHEVMTNKAFTRAAFSALVCIDDANKQTALEEIAQEKKYSQIGGVQDNRKLYDLQTQVRNSDEGKARHLDELRQLLKMPALGCKDAVVKATVTCVTTRDETNAVDAPCLEGKLAGPVEATLIVIRLEASAN